MNETDFLNFCWCDLVSYFYFNCVFIGFCSYFNKFLSEFWYFYMNFTKFSYNTLFIILNFYFLIFYYNYLLICCYFKLKFNEFCIFRCCFCWKLLVFYNLFINYICWFIYENGCCCVVYPNDGYTNCWFFYPDNGIFLKLNTFISVGIWLKYDVGCG